MSKSIRVTFAAAMVAAALASGMGTAQAQAPADPWPDIARDAFNNRPVGDGTGLLVLDMPYRAEDAAVVPVTVRATLPPGDTRAVTAITIVIDENPSPVAATFSLGPRSGVSEISTRVRVNSYTNVHAVAELAGSR